MKNVIKWVLPVCSCVIPALKCVRLQKSICRRSITFGCLLLLQATPLLAATIQNPYYTNQQWRVWMDDESPMTESINGTIQPPPVANRLYPDDVTSAEASAGLFVKMRTNDWPARKYAGFFDDHFSSRDGYHTRVESAWVGDNSNSISFKYGDATTAYRLIQSEGVYGSGLNVQTYGVMWENQSTTGQGDDQTDSAINAYYLEKDHFANVFRSGPSYSSYNESAGVERDDFQAYLPSYLNTHGASFGVSPLYTRILGAGGYLPVETKRKLLQNGLYASAMHYLFKASLPFQVEYGHHFRHRIHYWGYGINSETIDIAPDHYFDYALDIAEHYNPSLHMKNMIALAKRMTVAPPIALLSTVTILSGTNGYTGAPTAPRTAALIKQGAGQTVQVRVSTSACYDINGLPVDVRLELANGNPNTTIAKESGSNWLITVPDDADRPDGRTTILMIANNGIFDSNPAAITVSRFLTDGLSATNARLPHPVGARDTRVLAGTTKSYDLFTAANAPRAIDYLLWDGATATLDGNRIQLAPPLNATPATEGVVAVATDGLTGNGMKGTKLRYTIVNTLADIQANVTQGPPPLTVNFDGSASGDKNGGAVTLAWDFGDGGTSTSTSPSHTYTNPGIYVATLTATGPLGSDTAKRTIEVSPSSTAWPIVINNGWTKAGGIDPAVWTTVGSTVAAFSPYLKVTASPTEGSITSVTNLTLPAYAEFDFAYPLGYYNYIEFFGQRFGTLRPDPDATAGDRYPFAFEKMPHVAGTPSVPVAFITAGDDRTHRLRMFAEADPGHPGRMRITGRITTAFTDDSFSFDDLEIVDNKLRVIGQANAAVPSFELWRAQVWSPTGTPVTTPSLAIYDSTSTLISDDAVADASTSFTDDRSFGIAAAPGATLNKTFTIRNTGNDNLYLTGSPLVKIITAGQGFAISSLPPSTNLAPGAATTFTVTYTDTGALWSGTLLEIKTSDTNRTAYRFPVQAYGYTPPELEVRGHGLAITNGRALTYRADHTLFTNTEVGQSQTNTFNLFNIGTGELTLSNATLSGGGAAQFSIVKQPRASVGAFGSTALQISYHPAAAGTHTATLTVTNNDADEGVMTWIISGTATATAARDLRVSYNGNILTPGDLTPALTDGTDFGPTAIGASANHSFDLTALVGNVRITSATISGSTNFAIQQDPAWLVTGSRPTTLRIFYLPVAVATNTATLTLVTDDVSTPTMTFALSGEGQISPVMSVTGNGVAIASGDAVAQAGDFTDFGNIAKGIATSRSFVVKNTTANSTLVISGVTFSGANGGDLTATANFPLTLAFNQTATITLNWTPQGLGTRTATVGINDNSLTDNPYTFALAALATPYVVSTPVFPGVPGGLLRPNAAFADFDKDGDLDLALMGNDPNNIYYNTVGGPAVQSPSGVFRNDGANWTRVAVSTLLNLSDGDIAWSDIDNDGKLDVLAVGQTDNANSAIYNTTNGNAKFRSSAYAAIEHYNGSTFTQTYPGTIGGDSGIVAIGDYDNDGKDDFFTSGWAGIQYSVAEYVALYHNDGGRTYTMRTNGIPVEQYQAGEEWFESSRAEWFDMDRDGDLDLVVAGLYINPDNSFSYAAVVWLNNGNGTFTKGAQLTRSNVANKIQMAVADFDGDGDFDILISNDNATTPGSTLFLNDGTGTFTTGWTSSTLRFTCRPKAIDLDNDGDLDVLVTKYLGSGSDLGIRLLNNGTGTFTEDAAFTFPGIGDMAIALGDIDNNGTIDFFTSGRSANTGATATGLYQTPAASGTNAPPDYPTALTANVVGTNVTFNWTAPTDDTTPSAALTYRLRIGTAPGTDNIVSGLADLATGRRYVVAAGQFQQTSWHYTLTNGNYYVAVQAIDNNFAGGAWSPERIVTVGNITPPVNTAPVAVNDAISVSNKRNTLLDVLTNDTDAEAQALYLNIITQPATGGTVTRQGGFIRFNPTPDFNGTSTFTYTVTDGNLTSSPATVTLTVGDDYPPVANAGPDFTTAPNTLVTLNGTASDADGDAIAVAWTQQSGPAVTLGGTIYNATFTPTVAGVYVFVFTATANGASATDTATITVTATNSLFWAGGIGDASGSSVDTRSATAANLAGVWNAANLNWNPSSSATTGYQTWSNNSIASIKLSDATASVTPDIELAQDITVAGLNITIPGGGSGSQAFDWYSSDSANRTVTLAPNALINLTWGDVTDNFQVRPAEFVAGRGGVILAGTGGFTLDCNTSGGIFQINTPIAVSGKVQVNGGILRLNSTSSLLNASKITVRSPGARLDPFAAPGINFFSDTATLVLACGQFSMQSTNTTTAYNETIGSIALEGTGWINSDPRASAVATVQSTLNLASGFTRGGNGHGVLEFIDGTNTDGGPGCANGVLVTGHGFGNNAFIPYGIAQGRGYNITTATDQGTAASVRFLATDASGKLGVVNSTASSADLTNAAWQGFTATSDVHLEDPTFVNSLAANATMRSLAIGRNTTGAQTFGMNSKQLTVGSLAWSPNAAVNLTLGVNDATRGTLTSTGSELYLIHHRANIAANSSLIINSVIFGNMDVICAGSTAQIQLNTASTYTGRTFVNGNILQLNSTASLPNTSEINLASGCQLITTATNLTLGGGTIQKLSGSGTVRADTRTVSLGSKATLAPGNPNANDTLTFNLTSGKLDFAAGSKLALDLGSVADSDKIVFTTSGNWLTQSGQPTLTLALGAGFDYTQTYPIFQGVTTAGFTFAAITGYDTAHYVATITQSGDSYLLNFAPVPALIVNLPTGYAAWSAGIAWNGADSSLLGAPAGDGIANLMKYALGLNPLTSGYQGRFLTGFANMASQTYLQLTYTRPEPAPANVSYLIEAANELAPPDWTENATVVISNTVTNNTRTITVRDQFSTAEKTKHFMRLKVTETP
ncbi:MAG: choice-of-anchor D domain-containing protein [Kiritimatiellaceae bacterium]|nr:choice-of-anchor D domain-containing protein [Kiritimatiellaceae bacterium]